MSATMEQLVREWAPRLIVKGRAAIFRRGGIPESKLANALASYATEVRSDTVLALCDTTSMGGAREGFLLTGAALYGKVRGEPFKLKFDDIGTVEEDESAVRVWLEAGGAVTLSDPVLHKPTFAEFLRAVVAARDAGLTDQIDGFVIVEDMPDALKVAYCRVVVLMTAHDDQHIDERELAELQLLMSRIKCSPAVRAEVRGFVVRRDSSLAELLAALEQHAPRGSTDALQMCLLKDLIQVFRATKPSRGFVDSPFLQQVAALFGISTAQAKVIEEACAFDERLLRGEFTEGMFKAQAKELAAKASAVGVPLAAVYLSGSVVGMSAAGITSGLAALGMGGLFGLSSMVTGIGVVVLLGVTAYKGATWLMRSGVSEFEAQRELMLQQVVRLHQTTISHLAEDVNYLAARIVEAVRQAEIGRRQVEHLARELEVFSQALETLRRRGEKLAEASA